MNRQRFKLSPFCWLVTTADFVDYIVKKAQFVITCNYKVIEDGKTNPTKKDDVNRLKNRRDFSVFLMADTGGGCRRIHNERSDFAADILQQSLREMIKEANKKKELRRLVENW